MKRICAVILILLSAAAVFCSPFDRPLELVIIDPGHGGSDPGAVANGINEKDINLAIALELGSILEDAGLKVIMTRTDDSTVSLQERSMCAVTAVYSLNASAVFVSIHANSSASPGATGFEVFTAFNTEVVNFLVSGSPLLSGFRYISSDKYELSAAMASASDTLAGCVLKAFDASDTGLANRGAKEDDLYVLNCCRLPGVLIETAFVSNPADAAMLSEPGFRSAMAELIADGVLRYKELQAGN